MANGWRKLAAIFSSVALLCACNSDSQTAGIDRGGVRTPVVAEGPITGFGSIIVNGVHYDVAKAAISVDGAVASVADLQLGQLVTVIGEREVDGTTGTAESVRFQTNVRGPVQVVDVANQELKVLSQSVVVAPGTVLDLGAAPPALASIHVDDVVVVSGFVGGNGVIQATRIERGSANRGFEISGTVASLDTALLRFAINDLVVDYSGVLVLEGFPNGQPANGDHVVVKGPTVSAGGALVAREIDREAEDEHEHAPGQEAEVEGLISRFVSPLDFDVAGRAARTTAATLFEGGTAGSLALNVKVEIEGDRDAGGVIVARKVEIKDGGSVVAGGDD